MLLGQQYWIIALIVGALMVAFPCFTINKDFHFATSSPTTLIPVYVGLSLIVVSVLAWAVSTFGTSGFGEPGAVDLKKVSEDNGVLSVAVGGCRLRVVLGRIEDYQVPDGAAVVLPSNEYFDKLCISDLRGSLGAYINKAFRTELDLFCTLVESECRSRLGATTTQQKTDLERAESYGPGRSILLREPLRKAYSLALISTTTQRAGQGLAAKVSYIFEGLQELATKLADARINEIVMPVLGAGHGGIRLPLAIVGLLLAVAEVAQSGQGNALRCVTIVVLREDSAKSPTVSVAFLKRALALVA